MLVECSKTIEIDAGHRVTNHGGKCRNMHGHRYRIEAFVVLDHGGVQSEGSSEGMVVDFGFLKADMTEVIADPCDHAFIAWAYDDEVLKAFFRSDESLALSTPDEQCQHVRDTLALRLGTEEQGGIRLELGLGRLYVVPFVPTAENLAIHWGRLLRTLWLQRGVRITRIRVHETPTSVAEVSF